MYQMTHILISLVTCDRGVMTDMTVVTDNDRQIAKMTDDRPKMTDE